MKILLTMMNQMTMNMNLKMIFSKTYHQIVKMRMMIPSKMLLYRMIAIQSFQRDLTRHSIERRIKRRIKITNKSREARKKKTSKSRKEHPRCMQEQCLLLITLNITEDLWSHSKEFGLKTQILLSKLFPSRSNCQLLIWFHSIPNQQQK